MALNTSKTNKTLEIHENPKIVVPVELRKTLVSLAGDFALEWISTKIHTERRGVVDNSFKEQFDKYMSQALYVVYKLGYKVPVSFNGECALRWREIHSDVFRKLSGKDYKTITDSLIRSGIITRGRSYSRGTEYNPEKWTKEYDLTDRWRNLFSNMKARRIPVEEVEFPEKAFKVLAGQVARCDVKLLNVQKAHEHRTDIDYLLENCGRIETVGCKSIGECFYNAINYENELKRAAKGVENKFTTVEEKMDVNRWQELTIDDNALAKCLDMKLSKAKRDPRFILLKHKMLEEMSKPPVFIKNRWYHFFHRLPKKFRSCLLFGGDQLVELFDISGCDTKALAKCVEEFVKTDDEKSQVAKFQQDVLTDRVRRFFKPKKNGKCCPNMKLAWKRYLFSDNDRNWFDECSEGKHGVFLKEIDNLMKNNYPIVREFCINVKDFWLKMMELETEIVSGKMCHELLDHGIKSVTCHDAIFVKKSDAKKLNKIEELFYKFLNLKYIDENND